MIKKFLLFAIVALPATIFAQEGRIAHLNHLEVITAMPEFKLMQDSLQKSAEIFDRELQQLQENYTQKANEYFAQRDTLHESIKVRKEQELQSLQQNAQNYQQYAQEKQQELEQTLSTPVLDKFQKAVDDVAKENNFLFILNSAALYYSAPNAPNATPMVKKKLGLQ